MGGIVGDDLKRVAVECADAQLGVVYLFFVIETIALLVVMFGGLLTLV